MWTGEYHGLWAADEVIRLAEDMTPSIKLLRAEVAEIVKEANRTGAIVEDLIWDAI